VLVDADAAGLQERDGVEVRVSAREPCGERHREGVDRDELVIVALGFLAQLVQRVGGAVGQTGAATSTRLGSRSSAPSEANRCGVPPVHSFARLRGFGLALVPFAPYVIRRIGDGSDDRIAIDHDRQRAVLDPHAAAPSEAAVAVADVSAVPDAHAWCIEFGCHSVPWPNHFALASSELEGVPFELTN